ncbi:hypothetical protein [Tengunoibacter tsumagoiensis]|uniref:Uncharacterized protein n=1 Tax=Tengunoibacter tsumagoiensis TaxID=2014871 RepID=A0A401ZZ38_9CHLR|nr:hypothetical protein [Tengunoibacter tsumagoiensis]GCE12101.1 hypothetical protein KTT_19600 [Tengunoibacter tsumagoiensis]
MVMNQLRLARDLGLSQCLAWEPPKAAVTPRQMRRVMNLILGQVGTSVRVCQPRGKSPEHAKGFHPKQEERHEVVNKGEKEAKEDTSLII